MRRETRWIDGQSLVEFCLVLPLLLVLLSVAIEVARYVHFQMVLEDIAVDAARYASVKDVATGEYPTASQVQSRIQASCPASLGNTTIQENLNARLGGQPAVSIKLSCPVRTFSLALDGVIPNPFMLQAEAWHPKR